VGFGVFSQRVALTSNEIVLDWYGTAPGYRVLIGSTPGASDVRSVDVTATRFVFLAARTANTYYARVVATDGDQTSAPTFELTVSNARPAQRHRRTVFQRRPDVRVQSHPARVGASGHLAGWHASPYAGFTRGRGERSNADAGGH